MPSLRTPSMKSAYQAYQKAHPSDGSCAICAKTPLKSFTHWKITSNEFPYDLIAREHHMIVPVRHVAEDALTKEETDELAAIKETYLNPTYDYIIEATPKNKSIPAHFHLHLIIGKE